MSLVRFFLILLFLPVFLAFVLGWIIYWKFWGKKQAKKEKKQQESRKRLLTHIYNFSPVRLKNKLWRNVIKQKKQKAKKRTKKT